MWPPFYYIVLLLFFLCLLLSFILIFKTLGNFSMIIVYIIYGCGIRLLSLLYEFIVIFHEFLINKC